MWREGKEKKRRTSGHGGGDGFEVWNEKVGRICDASIAQLVWKCEAARGEETSRRARSQAPSESMVLITPGSQVRALLGV